MAIVFSGMNGQVVNGQGSTDTSNEVGNLTVAYNGSRDGGDRRIGSHMVVMGSRHDFSGYGGIVAGDSNGVGGPYARVTGGKDNAPDGFYCSGFCRLLAALARRRLACGSAGGQGVGHDVPARGLGGDKKRLDNRAPMRYYVSR